jgi:hypothetical protein
MAGGGGAKQTRACVRQHTIFAVDVGCSRLALSGSRVPLRLLHPVVI